MHSELRQKIEEKRVEDASLEEVRGTVSILFACLLTGKRVETACVTDEQHSKVHKGGDNQHHSHR